MADRRPGMGTYDAEAISPCASCPSGNSRSCRPAAARHFRSPRGRARGPRAICLASPLSAVAASDPPAAGGGGGSRKAATSFFRLATSSCSRAISFSSAARSSGTAWQAQPTAVRTAKRDLPARVVEAQEAVVDAVEGIAARHAAAARRPAPARAMRTQARTAAMANVSFAHDDVLPFGTAEQVYHPRVARLNRRAAMLC